MNNSTTEKYVNLGQLFEIVEQDQDFVTIKRAAGGRVAYLGRAEFEKRFRLYPNTLPPSSDVVGFNDAYMRLITLFDQDATAGSFLSDDGDGGFVGGVYRMAREIDMLRAGIKRLSDEEELCAETTGDDPYSMVYLAAKLAATERRISDLETERDNLASIVASGIDEVAGAALDDAEETIQRLIANPSPATDLAGGDE